MTGRRPLEPRTTWMGLLALCCSAAPDTWAARPLATDDAPILDPGQCQLETWIQHDPLHTHYWAVPACNAGGAWEVGAGMARLQGHGGSAGLNLAVIQAKTELAAPKNGWWRLGMAIASEFEAARGPAGNWSVNFPLTVDLNGDRLQWHTNAGWRRERDGSPKATWAIALEAAVGQRTALTMESFGVRGGGAWRQLGVRYALLPGRADADIAWGEKAGPGNRERYYSAGLTIYTNPP